MLSFFRQRGLSNLLYGAIILATILTFVIEFRPNASQRTASWTQTCVARVRGRCIEPKDFQAAYRILMPTRSAQMSRRMNLKRVALDGLIERELLDDEARRLGISVSEDEVTDQLYDGFVRVSVPAEDPAVAQSILYEMYQSYARAGLVSQDVAQTHVDERDAAIPIDFRDPKTKVFDMKTYERQVRNISNRSTVEFREGQVRELLAAKMRDVVREPIRVSGSEAWEEYERRYSSATVAWIPVKESWAARWAVDANPAGVDAWVAQHQAEVDEQVKERTKDDAPKAGHIRQILVKLPYGASDEEKAVALAKLSWAFARIKSGEPFAEVARDTSDDSSSAVGGDVGDMTAPFKAAADALRPGEMTSGAVETQYGYHLLAKDDPSKQQEVDGQLKHAVSRAMFRKAKATEAAKSVASTIAEAIRGGKSVDDAIAAAVAPYLTKSKVEALKVLPAPRAAAGADGGIDTAAGTVSPAVGDAGAAPSAKTTAVAAGRFDASTDTNRPELQTSSAFNRGGDPFPGLSPDGTTRIVDFAFTAKSGAVMSEPIRAQEGFVVVQAKDHKTATRDEFEKNRDALEQELLRGKRDEALSLYVRRLRRQAKDAVKVDESFVQEARVDGGPGAADDDEDQY
jgi:peptidyl-prolyl cis-trans isomerase D